MKFSWKWIKELINSPDITLEESINKLTLAGFEIETIDKKKDINDITLDLSITANRSDAASIIGITRELKTILKVPKPSSINTNIKFNTKNNQFHTININKSQFNNKNLSDIKITIIKNIQVKDSPGWLINKLKGCEIIQKDTLSNISKYINIKWGQDIEIFDINKINNKEFQQELLSIRHVNIKKYTDLINISNKNSNNFIESLTYKNSIISLLGIKSNSDFYCNSNTSSIIILGHICKPKYIKNTIQLLKYKTEKSQKHLKVLSRHDFIKAYDETIDLVLELTNTNTYINYCSQYIWQQKNTELTHILINTQKIQYILGTINQERNLNTQEIIDILQKLNFEPKQYQNLIQVSIPEYRKHDIKREIDVIEEIGRIYGFNHFMDQLPQRQNIGYISKINILIKKIRHILKQLGLYEVIHYSLNNIEKNNFYISVHNPLQEDQTHLRHYLLYNLLNTLKYNKKQKNIFMECFEIGKTFQQQKSINNKKQTYYKENINLAGIIGKNHFSKRLWSEKGKELSWFQAKGLLENLFEQIHAKVEWTHYKSNNLIIRKNHKNIINICQPYKFAILTNKINQNIIGIFGELNIKYSKDINPNYKNYIFEIDLIELIKSIHIKKHLSYIFTKYSLYPSVTRNICLKLNQNITAELIKKILISHNQPLIESIEIIDEYYANSHQKESRNINYKITYRSLNKTLNESDINTIDSKLNQIIKDINTLIT